MLWFLLSRLHQLSVCYYPELHSTHTSYVGVPCLRSSKDCSDVIKHYISHQIVTPNSNPNQLGQSVYYIEHYPIQTFTICYICITFFTLRINWNFTITLSIIIWEFVMTNSYLLLLQWRHLRSLHQQVSCPFTVKWNGVTVCAQLFNIYITTIAFCLYNNWESIPREARTLPPQ